MRWIALSTLFLNPVWPACEIPALLYTPILKDGPLRVEFRPTIYYREFPRLTSPVTGNKLNDTIAKKKETIKSRQSMLHSLSGKATFRNIARLAIKSPLTPTSNFRLPFCNGSGRVCAILSGNRPFTRTLFSHTNANTSCSKKPLQQFPNCFFSVLN